MARISPFQGVRFNPALVRDLSSVVTPPYDVIDSTAQKKYYEKSPYNIIRLELGYQYPTDDERDNRYTRAAGDYRKWLQEGVLFREEVPALYLYEQEFSLDHRPYRRSGFFARVELEEYRSGTILPHEETLTKPKADRLELMSACLANFSPVFSLYEDPAGTLAESFEKIKKGVEPDIDITDEIGERHRLWVIRDPALHRKAASLLANKVLYIADGHHRYETALTFYHGVGEKVPGASSILTYLVNTGDPGLIILPTHRIVRNLPHLDLTWFKERVVDDFTVREIPSPSPGEIREVLHQQLQQGEVSFIMVSPEPAAHLLTLKNKNRVRELIPERSAAWCGLDVSVLHVLILQQLLGIDADRMSNQENLWYTRDEAEALNALKLGDGQLAFFLNPTRIEQVTAVAGAGDKMPQKSTYFYPKLLTGLVINDLIG